MRQDAPHGPWRLVALEASAVPPDIEGAGQEGPATLDEVNREEPAVRRRPRRSALLHHGLSPVQARIGSGRLADRRSDTHGTSRAHHRHPQAPPNLVILTARHYSRVEVQAEGPRPIPPDVSKASADELRAVWGPFVGEAGTYEVTGGNLITMRPMAAKNPAAMAPGAFIVYTLQDRGRHHLGDAAAESGRTVRQSGHDQGRARRATVEILHMTGTRPRYQATLVGRGDSGHHVGVLAGKLPQLRRQHHRRYQRRNRRYCGFQGREGRTMQKRSSGRAIWKSRLSGSAAWE